MLFLLEHERDHVAHRHQADHAAVFADQQMPAVIGPHHLGALAVGRVGADGRTVLPHHLAEGRVGGRSGADQVEDEVALRHEPDRVAAHGHRYGSHFFFFHQPGRFAAGPGGVERNQVP